MKKAFKLISILFVLFISSTALFAYDGTIYGGMDGVFTRLDWENQASDLDNARAQISNLYNDWDITKFFQITDNNADDEDYELINDLEEYIDDEYGIADNVGYSHVVLRGAQDDVENGWFILSHYSKKKGFLHYLYYYSAHR